MRMKRWLVAPHYCWDWDGLLVMPWHPEAGCCTCFWEAGLFNWRAWLRCWSFEVRHRFWGLLR